MPPSSVIVSPVLKESAAQMPQVAAVPIKTLENALSFSLIHAKKKFLTPERAALLQIRSRADGGTVNQHLVKGEK